jgi:hypothetical protein
MSRGMATIAIACLAGLVLVGCSRRVEPPPPSTTVIPEAEREVVEDSKKADKKRDSEKNKDPESEKKQESEKKMVPKEDEKNHAASLEAANEACRKESRIRGVRNLVVIFRRRSREKAYAKCMQKKGFNVDE